MRVRTTNQISYNEHRNATKIIIRIDIETCTMETEMQQMKHTKRSKTTYTVIAQTTSALWIGTHGLPTINLDLRFVV